MVLKKIQYVLLTVNALIGIFGISLLALGLVWLEVETQYNRVARYSHVLVSLFPIIFGTLMVAIMVVGWCGTFSQIRVFFDINSSILILSILLYFDFGIMALVLSSPKSAYMEKFEKELVHLFKHPKPENIKFYDYLQSRFKCCGMNGPRDYTKYYSKKYPESCCKTQCYDPFDKGCVPDFREYLSRNFKIAGTMLMVVVGLAIVAAILTFIRKKNLQRKRGSLVIFIPKSELCNVSSNPSISSQW